VYDADTGKVTPTPNDLGLRTKIVGVGSDCPIVAPGGTTFALAGPSGPVVVAPDGSVTAVARQGVPLVFSSDGKYLLIRDGGSTYRVAVDGSGGVKASEQMSNGCAIAPEGLFVAHSATSNKAVIYEVATDTARAIDGPGEPGGGSDTCTVTMDHRWMTTSSSLLDLKTAKGSFLDARSVGDQKTIEWFEGSYDVQVS
jgi:hypothetical protein